jgi:hypothetical protein
MPTFREMGNALNIISDRSYAGFLDLQHAEIAMVI